MGCGASKNLVPSTAHVSSVSNDSKPSLLVDSEINVNKGNGTVATDDSPSSKESIDQITSIKGPSERRATRKITQASYNAVFIPEIIHEGHDADGGHNFKQNKSMQELSSGLMFSDVNHSINDSAAVFQYIKKGELDTLVTLIDESYSGDINNIQILRGVFDNTPLICAIQYQRLSIIKLLLTNKAGPAGLIKKTDSNDVITPRNLTSNENVDIRALEGIINHANEKGATALLYAVMENMIGTTAKLLEYNVKVNIPPTKLAIYNPLYDCNMFMTPFSISIINNRVDICKLLMDNGCSVNTVFDFPAIKSRYTHANNTVDNTTTNIAYQTYKGVMNTTPLMLACAYAHLSIVRELLYHQSHPLRPEKVDFSVLDSEHASCLHHLCRYSVNNPIKTNITSSNMMDSNVDGSSSSSTGAEKDKDREEQSDWAADIVSLLAKEQALTDSLLNGFDSMGNSPLHLACEHKLVSVARALLSEGGRPSLASPTTGATPLHVAVKKRQVDMIQLLLEYGADPLTSAGGDSGVKGDSAYDLACKLPAQHEIRMILEDAKTAWENMRGVNIKIKVKNNEIDEKQSIDKDIDKDKKNEAISAASKAVVSSLINSTSTKLSLSSKIKHDEDRDVSIKLDKMEREAATEISADMVKAFDASFEQETSTINPTNNDRAGNGVGIRKKASLDEFLRPDHKTQHDASNIDVDLDESDLHININMEGEDASIKLPAISENNSKDSEVRGGAVTSNRSNTNTTTLPSSIQTMVQGTLAEAISAARNILIKQHQQPSNIIPAVLVPIPPDHPSRNVSKGAITTVTATTTTTTDATSNDQDLESSSSSTNEQKKSVTISTPDTTNNSNNNASTSNTNSTAVNGGGNRRRSFLTNHNAVYSQQPTLPTQHSSNSNSSTSNSNNNDAAQKKAAAAASDSSSNTQNKASTDKATATASNNNNTNNNSALSNSVYVQNNTHFQQVANGRRTSNAVSNNITTSKKANSSHSITSNKSNSHHSVDLNVPADIKTVDKSSDITDNESDGAATVRMTVNSVQHNQQFDKADVVVTTGPKVHRNSNANVVRRSNVHDEEKTVRIVPKGKQATAGDNSNGSNSNNEGNNLRPMPPSTSRKMSNVSSNNNSNSNNASNNTSTSGRYHNRKFSVKGKASTSTNSTSENNENANNNTVSSSAAAAAAATS